MVLRLALAQKIGLGTPDHALVATALPLVDGGPRRLVHGVLGTLLRRGVAADRRAAPARPSRGALARGLGRGGRRRPRGGRSRSGRRSTSASPTMPRRKPMPPSTAACRSRRAMSGWKARPSPSLPGFGGGRWWVQDLAASLPARLIPADAQDVLDLCAAPGGKTMQLAAAGHRVTAVDASESRLGRLRENLERTQPRRRARRGRRADLEADAPVRRDPARRALLGDRHVPPPSRGALPRPAARSSPTSAELQAQAARPRRAMAEARRSAGLFGLLARAAGRRSRSSRPSSQRDPRLRDRRADAATCPTS